MTFLKKKFMLQGFEMFFKAKLNAWNDSKLVLRKKKKILHHECGKQMGLLVK